MSSLCDMYNIVSQNTSISIPFLFISVLIHFSVPFPFTLLKKICFQLSTANLFI